MEIIYGGDGIRERGEYRSLKTGELRGAFEMMTDELESTFEASYALNDFDKTCSTDAAHCLRELSFVMPTLDKADDIFVFDEQNTAINVLESRPTLFDTAVVIRHTKYNRGPLEEEYFLSVNEHLPHTRQVFFHTFSLERFVGEAISVTVQSNNIATDDSHSSIVFERPLSRYDVIEFFKRTGRLTAYLAAGRAEKAAD